MKLKFAVIFFVFFLVRAALFAQGEFGSTTRSGMELYDGSGFVPSFTWDPSFNFAEYELGPGDVLNLQTWGAKSSMTKVYVSADYNLFIPALGPINVSGVRLGKLQELVNKKVIGRYKNTQGSIALYKPREFIVQLTGAVVSPGDRPSTSLIRLYDFVTKSGGLLPNASRIAVEIHNTRLNTVKTVNLQDFILTGDYKQNPFIQDGDSVFVGFQKNVVIVKGDLLKPGRFEFVEQTLPLDKIVNEKLGGLADTAINSGQVVISRLSPKGAVTQVYDHAKFFDPTSPVNFYNFQVENGDQIYFPSSSIFNPALSETVFITGEVKLPAPQKYQAGLPLSSYISAAGGTTSRANYEAIVIYKASGTKVRLGKNPTIEPGDTIYVPERTFKFWQDHLSILTTLLSVATVTLSLSR